MEQSRKKEKPDLSQASPLAMVPPIVFAASTPARTGAFGFRCAERTQRDALRDRFYPASPRRERKTHDACCSDWRAPRKIAAFEAD